MAKYLLLFREVSSLMHQSNFKEFSKSRQVLFTTGDLCPESDSSSSNNDHVLLDGLGHFVSMICLFESDVIYKYKKMEQDQFRSD